jgi:hypothetical protein
MLSQKTEMRRKTRPRFWLEVGLALTSAFLCLLTVASRDWIEAAFGTDPDRHSGLVEWSLVVALLSITVVATGLARLEWRRSVAATA